MIFLSDVIYTTLCKMKIKSLSWFNFLSDVRYKSSSVAPSLAVCP